jgi:hypothetical protein
MNKLLAVLVASTFVFGSATVLAADPPKDKAAMPAAAKKLEKPESVTADAWAKMSDADKQKAVDAAAKSAPAAKPATAAAPKKEKKGGC